MEQYLGGEGCLISLQSRLPTVSFAYNILPIALFAYKQLLRTFKN